MKVQPPAVFSKAEMDSARKRLQALPGQGQFELTACVCNLMLADLKWLGEQQAVLGGGSAVLHGKAVKVLAIILRPTVRHTYNEITKTLHRELTHKLVDFKEIRASDVLEILAKTTWPMGRNSVKFVWDGPKSPYYLPAATTGRGMGPQH